MPLSELHLKNGRENVVVRANAIDLNGIVIQRVVMVGVKIDGQFDPNIARKLAITRLKRKLRDFHLQNVVEVAG